MKNKSRAKNNFVIAVVLFAVGLGCGFMLLLPEIPDEMKSSFFAPGLFTSFALSLSLMVRQRFLVKGVKPGLKILVWQFLAAVPFFISVIRLFFLDSNAGAEVHDTAVLYIIATTILFTTVSGWTFYRIHQFHNKQN